MNRFLEDSLKWFVMMFDQHMATKHILMTLSASEKYDPYLFLYLGVVHLVFVRFLDA